MGRPKKTARAAKDDVRTRVLAAAVKLIDEHGLAALSMREVARAANVSHQAPYHYFADRDAILSAIASDGFDALADRLEKIASAHAPAVERLVKAGVAYVELATEHRAAFRLMTRPDFVDVAGSDDLRARAKRAYDVIPGIVKDCVEEGLTPAPSEHAVATLASSVVHGAALLAVDGTLAPRAHDVMLALRLLFEASTGPTNKTRRRAR